MSKVYLQKFPIVWESTASLAAGASTTSGSFPIDGYARLIGLITSNASAAGSGLKIWQGISPSGATASLIYSSNYDLSACSGSAFSIEVIGTVGQIDYVADSAASIFQTVWQLRPI
jgi:hypothetical protein